MDLSLTLSQIISNPRSHAMWLNSLSYLEYRGFRKIVRSQETEDMNLERLTHAWEEVRHALFFKQQAIKIGGKDFEFYNEALLLGGFACKKYFFDLDQGVSDLLKSLENETLRNSAYCIITWLIEQRAMSVYQVYDELLHARTASFSLSSVLREENAHLREMGEASSRIIEKQGLSVQALDKIEETAFAEMWNAFHKSEGQAA